jgi:hypothetical protein
MNGVKSYNIGIDGRMFMSNFLHVLHVELNAVPFHVIIQHVLDLNLILGIYHICSRNLRTFFYFGR